MTLFPQGSTVIQYKTPNPPDPPRNESATIRFEVDTWRNVTMSLAMVGVPNVARINAPKGVFMTLRPQREAHLAAIQFWHLGGVGLVSQMYHLRHTAGAPDATYGPALAAGSAVAIVELKVGSTPVASMRVPITLVN